MLRAEGLRRKLTRLAHPGLSAWPRHGWDLPLAPSRRPGVLLCMGLQRVGHTTEWLNWILVQVKNALGTDRQAREDFIQDYCNRWKGLNSSPLKHMVGYPTAREPIEKYWMKLRGWLVSEMCGEYWFMYGFENVFFVIRPLVFVNWHQS